MKRQNSMTLLLILVAALLLAACGGQDPQAAIQTGIAQTLEISLLQTAAAGGGAQQPTVAEETPTASQTATPAGTDTPSVPLVSVSENTNCRTGPSVHYGFVVLINTGQNLEVLATYPNGDYVIVRSPSGSGDCWLWLQYATQKDFSAYNLPAATAPPTPTPTFTPTPAFNWNGTWKAWLGGFQYTISITQSGKSISGSFPYGTETIEMVGSLSNDFQTATGTWEVSDGSDDGTFQLQIKAGNLNQFVGNGDGGGFEWCGARSGASMPSPCGWP
jgi:uncharacterized protein YgiM (DUF1202 family)